MRESNSILACQHVDVYHFKSLKSKLWYIVRVECYKQHVYAVKFYPKKYESSPNKYRLLTNTFEPRRIVNTCINILLDTYSNDSRASFGFIGANDLGESTYKTRRYRFYATLIASYFDDKKFVHVENVQKSAYLLINKNEMEQNPKILNAIEAQFYRLYDYFD